MVESTEPLDWELIDTFLEDCDEWLSQSGVMLLELQADPGNQPAIQSLFRAYHSIKGTCEFFPFLVDVKELAHGMEDLLSTWRESSLGVSDSAIECLLTATDLIAKLLKPLQQKNVPVPGAHDQVRRPLMLKIQELYSPSVLVPGPVWEQIRDQLVQVRSAVNDVAISALLDRLHTHVEEHTRGTSTCAAQRGPSIRPPSSEKSEPFKVEKDAAPAQDKARTMRIAEAKLDEFLEYVGEFVTLREVLSHFGERLRSLDGADRLRAEYSRTLGMLSTLTLDLQKSVMEVRKVPLKGLLQRAPRIAHDVAVSTDKKLTTKVTGTELMVDKSLLEQLESPLTHILRNAVDHGLELPSERLRAGKNEVGTVIIEAVESERSLTLAIRDDGGGIDSHALAAKAVFKGLIKQQDAAALSEAERCQLLFLPGLSTADSVTSISGRGVGMDVVARNIKDLGGSIDIKSQVGRGTTFTLEIPTSVTVNIVDAFVVALGTQQYVLPLLSVQESFILEPDRVFRGPAAETMIVREDKVLQLVDLALALDVDSSRAGERIVVALDFPGGTGVGLVVDAVVGVQHLVLREIDGLGDYETPFSGGATLGDGRVALALDLELFAERLRTRAPKTNREPQRQATV